MVKLVLHHGAAADSSSQTAKDQTEDDSGYAETQHGGYDREYHGTHHRAGHRTYQLMTTNTDSSHPKRRLRLVKDVSNVVV
jgi:hypothetical protein